MLSLRWGLALCAVALPLPAFAAMEAAADCSAPAELTEPFLSWRSPVPLQAATDRKGTAKAELTAGHAAAVALSPTPKVAYALRPEKPGGSVSFGGMARFVVPSAGLWRVALSSGAWVDVVKDGKAHTSVAHGHGPECSGVRKMVDYDLQPGTYTLQIAANGEDRMTVLVTPIR
ncbi:MAG: hypothetical protein QM605_16250 [Sphingobium sp.]